MNIDRRTYELIFAAVAAVAGVSLIIIIAGWLG